MVEDKPLPAQRETWLPAAILIFIQITNGMRNIPQLAFFVIYLQEQHGLTPVMISSVVAGAQVAGMLTALLGGVVTQWWGSKGVLQIGLVLSAIGSLAFQAPTLWLAALLWFFGGAGLALVSVGGGTYLTRVSMRGGLGLLAAFFVMSTTAGGTLGNPLAALLIERWGYAAFSWAGVGITLLTIAVVAIWMAPLPLADDAAGQATRAPGLAMIAALRQANVRMVISLRSLPTIFYGALGVLIPLLLNDLTGSKALVAAYGTVNLIVATLAQLAAGRSADRWGARNPSLVSYVALVIAGLGLALWANTVWGLFLFGVLGIAAAWALAALMYVWVNDGVAKPDHPDTFGLLHAVWSVTMIIGSVAGGWLVVVQPGLPFLIAGLFNIGSLFLTLAFYRRVTVETGPALES